MQGNKEHPKSATNYKYVTALRQKDEIVNAQLAIEPRDRVKTVSRCRPRILRLFSGGRLCFANSLYVICNNMITAMPYIKQYKKRLRMEPLDLCV